MCQRSAFEPLRASGGLGSPWLVVVTYFATERSRRVSTLGLCASTLLLLYQFRRHRLNGNFHFELPVDLWSAARLIRRGDRCAFGRLAVIPRHVTAYFTPAIFAPATCVRSVRGLWHLLHRMRFGTLLHVEQQEHRRGLRSPKCFARVRVLAARNEQQQQHVPCENEDQNARLTKCPPLNPFHAAHLGLVWQSDCGSGRFVPSARTNGRVLRTARNADFRLATGHRGRRSRPAASASCATGNSTGLLNS